MGHFVCNVDTERCAVQAVTTRGLGLNFLCHCSGSFNPPVNLPVSSLSRVRSFVSSTVNVITGQNGGRCIITHFFDCI